MAGMMSRKFKTVDEYFSALSPDKRKILKDLRQIIRHSAPDAEELISYNMPAYKYHGMLVYYAAHTEHIGFYPGNNVVNQVFKDELKEFKTSKGTVQFPINKSLPKNLIIKIVKFRVKENLEKEKAKRKK